VIQNKKEDLVFGDANRKRIKPRRIPVVPKRLKL